MAQIAPTPSTPLGPVPTTADPANFDSRADAFLAALPTYQTELDALGTNVFNNAVDAYSNALSAASDRSLALTYKNAAQQSAIDAAAAAGASAWVSLTTYNPPQVVYSLVDYQTYRCIATVSSALDPAYDRDHWAPVIPKSAVVAILEAQYFGAL